MKRETVAGLLAACLLMEGCSSRPREFTPQLANPASNKGEFDTAFATCKQLLVEGKLDKSGRAGSAAVGAGTGAGTAAIGAATATAVGGWSGVALASATIVLLPFAVLGGAWGMSRAKRADKEHAIKTALQGCLHDRGYEVVSWIKVPKTKVSAGPVESGK